MKHALNGKSLATDTAEKTAVSTGKGLAFERFFTDGKKSPFDAVEWEKRTALIGNEKGVTIFRQEDVEVPKSWSQTATNIVTSKYFHGKPGTPQREGSVRQLIGRVVNTIVRWGQEGGYFADAASRDAFRDELTHLLVEQKMAFNSPVWFNVGVQPKPQCSACFINSVSDSMESIMGLTRTEGMLFKWGSGTGTNFSTLRGSRETLSGGGIASGPVSFMKGFDAFAGVIKSGGKTRRAAKMVILNIDHPDIVEFIECKMKEERKAHVLIEQGYDSSIDGDAYASIFFQNANHSVRVTDDFMRAVVEDKDWWTKNVTDGQPAEKLRARDLMMKISDSTWHCGDPGMQYDTTVNRWHTSKNTARINASNPCSEYMFLDDTACNLASLNLMKFANGSGQFDVAAFKHAVDVTITAQEILVDNASYPTPKIAENSHNFRPLGLGYANLGALLMSMALPYDSPQGRDVAGAITALMCGEAYAQSSKIAERMGPFPGYEVNREPMLDVIRMHRDAMRGIQPEHVQTELFLGAQEAWDTALSHGEKHGYKNSQVTVLAPTGTIGFMMDCDTTGIEPDLALVKYKKLVGGGLIKIVNNTVPQALMKLGYTPEQTSEIVSYIDKNGKIEGAPHLKAEDLPVFDCSLAPQGGGRSISWTGHVKMMAAAQPFLSGAISKTINMPEESTIEDIMNAYIESWNLGLKAVAIYRDNSKRSQPLNAGGKKEEKKAEPAATTTNLEPTQRELFARAVREKMPVERASVTHKFSVGGHEGYITVGMYEDNRPGEIFIKMSKEGSTLSGVMDGLALTISLGLQYGVPLKVFVDKLLNTRFEPSGITANPNIRFVSSVLDYIARWLGGRFISSDYLKLNGGAHAENAGAAVPAPAILAALTSLPAGVAEPKLTNAHEGAPTCSECGMLMVPNGACYKCENCGSTSGCS
ncbi:MAG: ribonucleoside-diphosphate reductase, adenosylcobalamin-dependent [Acidobacteria bacterium 13_2_20CM_57_17]|nr:MAG: ribonucleoside-diphosphate reductase, adenosylcobalamin-dependent [Acidobacteria bacterium 13_2_20CM_57_17]